MNTVPPTKSTDTPKLNVNINRDGSSLLLNKTSNTPQSLEGKVVRQNQDGSTRIQTPKGAIDVKINGDKPAEGTRVIIDIRQTQQGKVDIKLEILPNQQRPSSSPTPQQTNAQQTQPAPTPAPTTPPVTPSTVRPSLSAPPTSVPYTQTTVAPPSSSTQATPPAQQTLQTGQTIRIEAGLPPLPNNITSTQQTNPILSTLGIVAQASTSPLPSIINNLGPISTSSKALLQNIFGTSSSAASSGNITQNVTLLPQKSSQLAFNSPTNTNTTTSSTLQTGLKPITTSASGLGTNSVLGNISTLSQSGITKSFQTFMTSGLQSSTLNAGSTANLVLSNASFSMNVKILSMTAPSPLFSTSSAASQSTNAQVLADQAPNGLTSNTRPGQITGIIQPNITLGNGQVQTPITLYNGVYPINGQFFLPSNIKAPATGTQLQLSISNISALTPNGQAISSSASGLQGLQQALMGTEIFANDILEFIEAAKQESAELSLLNSPALKFMAQAANSARLTSTLLFFMAALKGGDIKQWMGTKNLEMLNAQQKTDILSRLERSFGTISRSFADPAPVPSGEWRSFQLPMLFGMDLSRLQFHVRDYDYDDDSENQEGDRPLKRVIIDVTMSRMGDLQIDSLLMAQRLETVIRTESQFTADMRQDLRKRYTDIMARIGYQGHLDFQDHLKG